MKLYVKIGITFSLKQTSDFRDNVRFSNTLTGFLRSVLAGISYSVAFNESNYTSKLVVFCRLNICGS